MKSNIIKKKTKTWKYGYFRVFGIKIIWYEKKMKNYTLLKTIFVPFATLTVKLNNKFK